MVDYIAHVAAAYVMQDRTRLPSAAARVEAALAEVGGAVGKGALTTALGVLPLLAGYTAFSEFFFKVGSAGTGVAA